MAGNPQSYPLSLASHLMEVWLAVAENVPFARMMLHGLMGRLQSRFTPRTNATSKADTWRLAAVDPLMVSHRGRPWAPRGAVSRALMPPAALPADPLHPSLSHREDGQER